MAADETGIFLQLCIIVQVHDDSLVEDASRDARWHCAYMYITLP